MGSLVPVALIPSRKIAVVGFASNTRDLAPYGDHSWEVWGLNNAFKFLPRFTRWFEMHDAEQVGALYGQEYVDFLKGLRAPVYMQKHYEGYPASVEFPLAKLTEEFGDFWPSSISYMLALAIHELTDPQTGRAYQGAEIGLYGVDLIGDDEYMLQREGCGYLIGIARGRGIPVHIPPPASLLKSAYRYGYEAGEWSPGRYEVFVNAQIQQYAAKAQEALTTYHTYQGAIQGYQNALVMFKHSYRGGALAGAKATPLPAGAP